MIFGAMPQPISRAAVEGGLVLLGGLTYAAATLRANVTLGPAAGRHTVRLASCLVAADALGRTLQLPRYSRFAPKG